MAGQAGLPLRDDLGRNAFGEHVFRVSGARHLARIDLPLPQSLGHLEKLIGDTDNFEPIKNFSANNRYRIAVGIAVGPLCYSPAFVLRHDPIERRHRIAGRGIGLAGRFFVLLSTVLRFSSGLTGFRRRRQRRRFGKQVRHRAADRRHNVFRVAAGLAIQ